ncbi:12822_t:CDS:10, partial [Acaulospora colombiana]
MSSIDKLQKCLQELSECRQNILQLSKNSLFQDNGEALRYCEDIEQIVFNDVDTKELDPLFLMELINVTDKTLEKAKIALFEFLFLYIERVKADIESYSVNIKEACLSILQFDDEALVRAASFKPMMAMFDSSVPIIDPEKMHIQDVLKSKIQSSTKVMAGVLTIIGIISRRFPEQSEKDQDKILRVFIHMLKDRNHSSAAFKGLHSFLYSFPDAPRKAGNEGYVFECIQRSIAMVENETRYDIAKTGFDYIINHPSIFGRYYLQHYEELWTSLWKCRQHINVDVRRAAFRAIGEFLKTHFISIFVNIWKSSNSKQEQKMENEENDRRSKDLSIAVRGVGYFAAPAKKIMDENRLQQLFHDLLRPNTWVVSGDNETLANVSQIPLFIEAYCYIGKEFDVIFEGLLETIEREVGIMLIHYPRLTPDLRLRSANVFEQLLWMLYDKGSGFLQKFTSKIFYQALILTCSDAVQSQERPDYQGQNISNVINTVADHTYQEMFDFWDHIFNDSTLTWVNQQSGHSSGNLKDGEAAKAFFSIIYDEFFLTVFRMIQALNFKVIDVAAEDSSSTMISETETTHETVDSNLIAIAGSGDLENLQPMVSKDFVIFQNLVDFWQLFLPRIKRELFSRWVYLSAYDLISFSTQYPYVSGFYKMLESCLKVCENIQFFNGIKKSGDESIMESDFCDQLLPSATATQRASYYLYAKFLKEVCARLGQYKDDLLTSCLRLVLSVPKELLCIDDLISPICIVLKLGQSHQPLANIGLDAIEKIVDLKGPRDLSKWLEKVLPFFNEYLLVKSDMMDNSLKEIAQFRENAQRNRRTLKSLEKARKQKIRESGIIKSAKTIVGQLEKNVGLHDLQHMSRACIPDHLRLRAEGPFHKTYLRVFPALLRLAIDTDQVPRKLFQRLVSQLIHWFTNNAQYENPETIALLKCFLEAICDSWSSLRDYGAKCLNEFLLWSIKQSSERQIEGNPMNMKSLFKRLYDFSAHPDYAKRLGSSLAVNHIYRVFREERHLVDQFTFELLYWMLFNLRLSEQDQDATGTKQQAITAIRHLKKIIKAKYHLFIKEEKNRRKFPGLARADLSSLVDWLFVETSRRESDYANMCRELFVEFIGLLSDFSSGSHWIIEKISVKPSFLSELYRISALSAPFVNERSANLLQINEWCIRFLCILENYTWLIKEKFVTPEILLRNEISDFRETINYFLDKMVLTADLEPFLDVMDVDDHQDAGVVSDPEKILTPAERSKWKKLRTRMIDRLIDFNIALLEVSVDNDPNTWSATVYNVSFFKTLAKCLFYTEKLISDGNTRDNLLGKLQTFLALFKHSSQYHLNQCLREIAAITFSEDVDLLNIEFDKSEDDVYSEKGEIVKAYCQGRQVKSKELTRKIMEISHRIKARGDVNEFMSKEIKEAMFLLRCAAYNALAAVIIRTQTNQQFYKTFLFSGNPSNGELLWENIVDPESVDLFDNTITGDLDESLNGDDRDQMSIEINVPSEPNAKESSREFEVDIINLNPCMKMIIKVIERLHSDITPPPSELAESMPGWMNEMYKKFSLKAFEKYASFWIRPLMKLIVEGDSFGEGINYFIQDLSAVITVWGSLIKLQSYEDKVLIYELLNFLMKNVVFRNNLQTIKGIFEIWAESIVVPTRVIYDYINSTNEDHILAGLQLLGIVLAHDKPPFQQEVGIDLGDLTDEKLYRNLTKKLRHTKYTIRDLCAEVCGMTLKHLRKYHCSDDFMSVLLDPILETVAAFYQNVMNKQTDANAFLTCVHHIAMHDPPVSEKFLRYVFNLLPRLNAVNDKKFLALELISY